MKVGQLPEGLAKSVRVRIEIGEYVVDVSRHNGAATVHRGDRLLARREHPDLHDLAAMLAADSLQIGEDVDELRTAFETERERSASILAAWQRAAEVHERKEAEWNLDKIRANELYREAGRLKNAATLDFIDEDRLGVKPEASTAQPVKLSPQEIAARVAADHIEPQAPPELPEELKP